MSTASLAVRIRADLRAALAARDRATAGVLRTVLGVIANAEAVSVAGDTDTAAAPLEPVAGPIAGAASGLGATEAARRDLTDDDVRALVAAGATTSSPPRLRSPGPRRSAPRSCARRRSCWRRTSDRGWAGGSRGGRRTASPTGHIAQAAPGPRCLSSARPSCPAR